jgi:hypothetical protein
MRGQPPRPEPVRERGTGLRCPRNNEKKTIPWYDVIYNKHIGVWRRSSMEHIIQQLAMDFTGRIIGAACNFTAAGIGGATEEMLELCKGHAAAIASAVLEHMDGALLADKAKRKADGLSVHERNVVRRPLTAIGQIEYRRTCFRDKTNGGTTYLLDHLVGVRGYERVCAHLSARLAHEAGGMPFEKSSLVCTGGAVSRQTVRNKLMRTEELAYVPAKAEDTPEELHVFADEDHVAMQSGRSRNVNLVTVSEGSRKVCEGRNELVSPMHVQGYKVKPEKHWEYVSALCYEKYDMSKVKRVYIHGDGAEWIKHGTDHFADAVHVLDKYHLNKHMKKLTAGAVCENYGTVLWHAIRKDDRAGFEGLVHKMACEMDRLNTEGVLAKKAQSVRDAGAYVLSNWDAIQRRQEEGMQGSCTEALISHVLSERLSRNPMGWSEDGLAQMAMVRVYRANGERVSAENIKAAPRLKDKKAPRGIEKYRDIVERQGKELLSKKRDWSIFEKSSYPMGLVTGTKRAYDALSKMRAAI